MVLNISTKIQENESLTISLQGEAKTLNVVNSSTSFYISDKGDYEIIVEQEPAKSNRGILFILLFFFTSVIQGIFHILLMNTESKWFYNIRAYCFKVKLLVHLTSDMDIHIAYKNSDFSEANQRWSLPEVYINQGKILSIDYLPNLHDFKNQYFNYIKRVVSVGIVTIGMFAFLLTMAIINTNVAGIICCSAVLVGTILLIIILLISQHKQLNRLFQIFRAYGV